MRSSLAALVVFAASAVVAAACDDDVSLAPGHRPPPTAPARSIAMVAPEAGPSGLTSAEDFYVPGTQAGDVPALLSSSVCQGCHQVDEPSLAPSSPYNTWSESLMSIAARDPLFYAQLTNANQDAPGVGSYCIRCHAPASVPSGHVSDPTGASLTDDDRDGVTCHLCHTMVDPTYVWGFSPGEDAPILLGLKDAPTTYGNAQFVLDPNGLRRGPYTDAKPLHAAIYSPFLRSADLCGTCHEVSNPEVSRRPDATYAYNAPYTTAPNADPLAQFPLERTYTEWKLSAFGAGVEPVTTCQDCHMPRDTGKGCAFADVRTDLARHEFAGAAAWVLEIAAQADPAHVDAAAMARGQANAVAMLQRAADLSAQRVGSTLQVRVTNQSGHKLPTGHIEGRRVWVDVVFRDAEQKTLAEMGAWDPATGDVDTDTTTVFEMKVGLSADAAKATGLPAGETSHMALADTIVKDTRIPPRGFANVPFAAAGAGVVGASYADGQNWADLDYAIPATATSAVVTLEYETVTPEYVAALANGNHTDGRGATLQSLWLATNRDPPIAMAQATLAW